MCSPCFSLSEKIDVTLIKGAVPLKSWIQRWMGHSKAAVFRVDFNRGIPTAVLQKNGAAQCSLVLQVGPSQPAPPSSPSCYR